MAKEVREEIISLMKKGIEMTAAGDTEGYQKTQDQLYILRQELIFASKVFSWNFSTIWTNMSGSKYNL